MKAPRQFAQGILKAHPQEPVKHLEESVLADEELRRALLADYLVLVALPVPRKAITSRRLHGRHRRGGKQPTPEQKRSTITAQKEYTHNIFLRKLRGGRRLGEIGFNELPALAQQAAAAAASFQDRGYDDQVEAIAFTALANYVVPSDPFALLKDVVKPTVVGQIFEQAQVQAAATLRASKARQVKDALTAGTEMGVPTEPMPQRRRRRGQDDATVQP